MIPSQPNVGTHQIKHLTGSEIGKALGRGNNPDTEPDSEFVLASNQPGDIVPQEIISPTKEEQEIEDREAIKAISRELSKLDNEGAGSVEVNKEKSHFNDKLEEVDATSDTKGRVVVKEEETTAVDEHVKVFDEPVSKKEESEGKPLSAYEKPEDTSFTSERSHNSNDRNEDYQSGPKSESQPEPAKKQTKANSRRPKNLGKISDNRVLGTEDGPPSSKRLAQRSR
ncbi:hypothetical protein KL937_002286 [Ogataea polymorpha]|nr:hypothetical protein KL937_002286 [Ogataea polymorpha]KAG7917749.1 hypothetical protein KL927_002492 [Ogataea polymorpha]KAG7936156.1 hypothetical protein KL904_002804 [Ogataea polymorpha]